MRRHFAGYCAFGMGLWMSLQSFVSIGVNLGLLPTKGLTLPLISSGGSSVLMTCAAMGLLLRVSYELDRAERQVARLRGESPAATAPVDAPKTATPVLRRPQCGGNRAPPAPGPVLATAELSSGPSGLEEEPVSRTSTPSQAALNSARC